MERILGVNREKLISLMCCSVCRGDLAREAHTLVCARGHGKFFIDREARWHLIDSASAQKYQSEHSSGVNRIKSFFKPYPRLYYFLWHIFCPVLLSGKRPSSVRKLISDSAVVVNLGSGPRRIAPGFVNVDVAPFPEVDIVADAIRLPFKDNSVDALVHESLFEHLPDPEAAAREIARVLKPGGIMYASIPFLTPYHASPDDFNRWTASGMRRLFHFCTPVEQGVDAGPWSAMLVFVAYWIGVTFSFGSRKAAPAIGLLSMTILGPLKIFDYLFARLPGADAVAAQLYFIGRKK